MAISPETKQLQLEIQRRKIERSNELTVGERFWAGARLYDEQMFWVLNFIKSEIPNCTEEQMWAEFDRRKRVKRKSDDFGRFQILPERLGDDSQE